MQGIIIENIANLYQVSNLQNKEEVYEATARGKFKKEEISPVVGDVVEIEVMDKNSKKAVINKIEERKVYVKRPKLANITQIVFVVSCTSPKPDLLMLDKQLVFAKLLGIKALIVLNKIDLDKKMQFKEIKSIYENIGYRSNRNKCQKSRWNRKIKKRIKRVYQCIFRKFWCGKINTNKWHF